MSNTQQRSDLIGQREQRIEKVKQLKKLGINPYPSKSHRTYLSNQVVEGYKKLEGKEVTVSGRLMSFRDHGKLVFGQLQDTGGRIQLFIRKEDLEDTSSDNQNIGFEHLSLLDVGDIIQVTGTVGMTKRDEVSVIPNQIVMLTKAIRPLPEKHAGLKDKELIFRQRYLDIIMNPENGWRFQKRAEITFAIREFLNSRGFLEIKTPIIQPVYGGTNANPFKTHVNALGEDMYLAIAHELYLKRFIVAGYENVYNIVGYFRNEGIDRTHNPEFEMLETMTAFQNYEYNMDLTEDMYKHIAQKVFNKPNFTISGEEVDFSQKWERISMVDAVKKHAGYDWEKVDSVEKAHKILDEIKFKETKPNTIGESLVKVFEEKVEEKLIQPTFVTGHPVEISPLAKAMDTDPRYVERFEVFMGGIEQGDNWTELNDPIELYDRFKDQVDRGRGGDSEAHPMDVEFLEAMEHGMPPTTGLGPGIDRLTMTMTETDYIDDVIFFPLMKPAPVTNTQKEIYGEEYVTVKPGDVGKNNKQDQSKKMVVVLNKKLEGWQLTNTIGHITAYLGNKIEDFGIESFETKDGTTIPANSQYAVVTKTAKPSQLAKLLQEIEDTPGVNYIAYTQDMIDLGDDVKLAKKFKKQNKEALNYLGIGVFGKVDVLDKLTKKYSLFK